MPSICFRRYLRTSLSPCARRAGHEATRSLKQSFWISPVLLLLTAFPLASRGTEPTIDAAFHGGNIVVERIEGDRVDLHQDLRDTEGSWFYWYFRVRGAAQRSFTFHFTQGDVIGVRGPAVSSDGGKTWQWLGTKAATRNSFRYAFGPDGEVRFCVAIPYLEANLREFLARHASSAHLHAQTLCITKKGRQVERLHLGKLDGEPTYRVLCTCRHHCCEMMASWALEGLMESVWADGDEGRWLRQNVEFLVIPFVDKDGVEDGDQGKNRKPHDHNRDYLGPSIYASVAAIRRFVPSWSQSKLVMALDLHCPVLRGGGNEQLVLVGDPAPAIWAQQQAFGRILQQVQSGPLVYDPKNNMPYGVGWNNLKEPRSFGRWASLLPGIRIAGILEVPYANAANQPVTPDSARALGHDLARAIRVYLARPKNPNGTIDKADILPIE